MSLNKLLEEAAKSPPITPAPKPFAVGPLVTIQKAAEELGIHAWALRRAVKRSDVPSYQGFNSRRLVRVSEVLAVINATRQGGV